MSRITPCLWFAHQAEEAAQYYVSLFPDSAVDTVNRNGPNGTVLLVEFRLSGQPYQALNGGPIFQFNEAISLSVDCADQREVDRLWHTLIDDGGSASRCGWLKDKFGLSWQIVPQAWGRIMRGSDEAGKARAMEALLQMDKLDIAALEAAYRGA